MARGPLDGNEEGSLPRPRRGAGSVRCRHAWTTLSTPMELCRFFPRFPRRSPEATSHGTSGGAIFGARPGRPPAALFHWSPKPLPRRSVRSFVRPELEEIWPEIQAELRTAVGESTYDLWLAQVQPVSLDASVLVLSVPDERRGWVADRFMRVLKASAAAALGPEATVE